MIILQKINLEMNWSEFIKYLFDQELRLSPQEGEKLTGIRYQIIDRWKRGNIGKPQRNTIKRLEEGLGIKINDSDPDNITYTKVEEKPKPDNKIIERTYRVVGEIGAGVLEVDELFQDEYVTVTFDPSNNQLFRIKSEKYSMAPTVMPGDMIVIDLAAKPKPGDMVVIGWRENGKAHGALKILNTVRDDFLAFTSINPAEPLLIVPRKELIKMFKVKQVIKE